MKWAEYLDMTFMTGFTLRGTYRTSVVHYDHHLILGGI